MYFVTFVWSEREKPRFLRTGDLREEIETRDFHNIIEEQQPINLELRSSGLLRSE
jgi:hypothetical protein